MRRAGVHNGLDGRREALDLADAHQTGVGGYTNHASVIRTIEEPNVRILDAQVNRFDIGYLHAWNSAAQKYTRILWAPFSGPRNTNSFRASKRSQPRPSTSTLA